MSVLGRPPFASREARPQSLSHEPLTHTLSFVHVTYNECLAKNCILQQVINVARRIFFPADVKNCEHEFICSKITIVLYDVILDVILDEYFYILFL